MRALPLLLLLGLVAPGVLSAEPVALGGETSRVGRGPNALSRPAANLSFAETERFFRGFLLFQRPWGVTAAANQAGLGLGPLHNATSCGACHPNDGRGPAPETDQTLATTTLQLRREGPTGWGPHPTLGRQLQPLFTAGPAEGQVRLDWEEIRGHHDDGSLYRLRRPLITVSGKDLEPGDGLSLRLPPALTGLGLLEAVPTAALADLAEENGGRLQRLPGGAIGRFGWKAERADIADQVALAAFEDLGLTSATYPTAGNLPELTAESLADLTFYTSTLAVPLAEDLAQQQRGATLFDELGCGLCHRPALITGTHSLPALPNQEIRPFTDLLLHDMGAGLADRTLAGGRSDDPLAALWRTPPLWALGKARDVGEGAAVYLHDGRARSPAEAILWHGGEAAAASRAFRALSAADRQALLDFLGAL